MMSVFWGFKEDCSSGFGCLKWPEVGLIIVVLINKTRKKVQKGDLLQLARVKVNVDLNCWRQKPALLEFIYFCSPFHFFKPSFVHKHLTLEQQLSKMERKGIQARSPPPSSS